VRSTSLATDLHLKFCDSALESEELLLECGFLALERGDLLLDSAILCFLEIEMPLPKVSFILHFFLDAD